MWNSSGYLSGSPGKDCKEQVYNYCCRRNERTKSCETKADLFTDKDCDQFFPKVKKAYMDTTCTEFSITFDKPVDLVGNGNKVECSLLFDSPTITGRRC